MAGEFPDRPIHLPKMNRSEANFFNQTIKFIGLPFTKYVLWYSEIKNGVYYLKIIFVIIWDGGDVIDARFMSNENYFWHVFLNYDQGSLQNKPDYSFLWLCSNLYSYSVVIIEIIMDHIVYLRAIIGFLV